jgi:monomeric isocitrate dehydrogenase
MLDFAATIDCTKNTWSIHPNYNGKCSKRRTYGSKSRRIGSHDKTFQIDAEGCCKVTDAKELF